MMFKIPWNLTDLKNVKPNGKTVFSCFHCGGGSTMGYKLAGFTVLGGVEIDPKMMEIYKKNHNPKYSFLMGVQDFNKIPLKEIPEELYNLDILDGSPPCSSFSMAGAREKKWGIKTHFREGQAEQILDDLFFHFIETARILKPKIVIAENVKGLVIGKAKGYVKQINQMFSAAGYDLQLFLLNAAFMGVPQKRERTFFIARRKDLSLPEVKLYFKQKPIPLKEALNNCERNGSSLPKSLLLEWNVLKFKKKGKYISTSIANPHLPCSTITSKVMSGEGSVMHWESPRKFSKSEVIRIQSFPDDFDFLKIDPGYVCGMSVPPVMMANIVYQINRQWFGG